MMRLKGIIVGFMVIIGVIIMKEKDKINKFLRLYSRFLLAVFGITMIMAGCIVLSSDTPTCYEEADQQELLFVDSITNSSMMSESGCLIVDDIDNIKKKYTTYKWVSIVCLAGIFACRVYNTKNNDKR